MALKRILFIVNPISGHHKKENFPTLVRDVIDKSRYECEIVYTERGGHAKELASQAVADKFDVVAAVGGDGTINEIAQSLIGTEVAMALIPYGSGNGLARCLHLPLRPKNALKVLNDHRVIAMDTAAVNDVPFVSIAGIGLDAQTAFDFSNDPRRGFLSYAKYALENYIHFEPQKYVLTFDDAMTVECSPLLISFANSNQFGYNAVIAPHSDLCDGLLDTCVLNRPPLGIAPLVASQMMLEKLNHSKYFTDFKAEKIVVKRPAEAVVNIDGEPIMFPENLEIKILPHNLNVLVKNNG